MAKIIIDPGHGGKDNGAVYKNRLEKNDTLELSMAVGEILAENGITVMYTRVEDIYNTPYEKAVIGNNSDADFFISVHRNAAVPQGKYDGAQVLVYSTGSKAGELARNIQEELVRFGFDDEGIIERKDLAVLRRTKMPAVLIEAGFIDNDDDNQLFDARFEELAQAIADGIMKSLPSDTRETVSSITDTILGEPQDPSTITTFENTVDFSPSVFERRPSTCPCQNQQKLYQVQVGSYQNYNNANAQLTQLLAEGYPAYIVYEDNFYKVRVGAYLYLENAVVMEGKLRNAGYNTYIST